MSLGWGLGVGIDLAYQNDENRKIKNLKKICLKKYKNDNNRKRKKVYKKTIRVQSC